MFSWLGRDRVGGGDSASSNNTKAKRQRAISRACLATEPLENRTLLSSYSFQALAAFVSTGNHPQNGVVQDSSGNLYAVTPNGAAYDDGSIAEVPKGTNTINMLVLFNGTNGAQPTSLVIDNSSGTLYGTTASSDSGASLLFQYSGGTITTLHTFSSGSDGNTPDALIFSGGNLFGTTSAGGPNSDGTIFEYNVATKTFSTLYAFIGGSDGADPSGGLLMDGSGNLDVTTNSGGGSSNDGTIFQFNPSTKATSTLHSFNGSAGANPNALILDSSTGNLYGTTNAGGSGSDGTLFRIAGGTFASLHSFVGSDGVNPDALILNSGTLVGTTNSGGTNDNGVLFQYSTSAGTFAAITSFDSTNAGDNPAGGLIVSGSNIVGTCSQGGSLDEGTVFQFNTSTTALTAVVNFGNPTGDASIGDLVPDSSGHFFGIGGAGGIGDDAGVWEFDPSTNSITAAGLFTGANGVDPQAIVWDAANSTLYGVTQLGGTGANSGVVFKIVNGTPVALHTFAAGTEGSDGNAFLLDTANGMFYGTTNAGGAHGDGTIFQFNPNTNTVTTLFAFNGSNGNNPSGSLLLGADGNLYGTTTDGGANTDGAIFKFNLSTQAYTLLASFNGTNGSSPEGDIALDSNENVYGTAQRGGANSKGTIFEESNGSITPLFNFSSFTTPNPNGVIRDSSGDLFGTTFSSGTDDVGQVFEFTGGTFSTLYSFTGGNDGANPNGGLYMDSSGSLWGSTEDGGARFVGTVYKLTTAVAPPVLHLAFIQSPNSTFAGNTISPAVTVAIENASGTIVTGDTSSVTLSLNNNANGASLGGTLIESAVNGTATFSNLFVKMAGNGYSLTASDSGDGLSNVVSGSFSITPASAAKLVFVQQPTNVTVNAAIAPAVTVDVVDGFGNIVTSDTSTVTMTTATGPGAVGGTTTATVSGGVATFNNLTFNTTGTNYSLNAADGALTAATSNVFAVNAVTLTATKLVFIQPPTKTSINTAFNPTVQVAIEDQNGNVVTGNTSQVTIAVASGPGKLSGTVSVNAVNGVATFTGITLTAGGTYTLSVTDGTLTKATSASFIVVGKAAKLVFIQQPTNVARNTAISPAVQVAVEDSNGNVVTSNTSLVTMSLSAGHTGALSGTLSVHAVNGIATFSNLELTRTGTYRLRATDSGLTAVNSGSFVVSTATAAVTASADSLLSSGIDPSILG